MELREISVEDRYRLNLTVNHSHMKISNVIKWTVSIGNKMIWARRLNCVQNYVAAKQKFRDGTITYW